MELDEKRMINMIGKWLIKREVESEEKGANLYH
jgi:hypothetical protein